MKLSLDGLIHGAAGVSRQGVMQVADEEVAVLVREGHERAAHHDKLHLVHTVAQLLQLHTQYRVRIRLDHY